MGFLSVNWAHMLIGCARVSTLEQNVAPQIDQLKNAGCGRIFRDKAGGAKTERPASLEALYFLREGDSLVVWRLDRLGRSLKHLFETGSELEECRIGVPSTLTRAHAATFGYWFVGSTPAESFHFLLIVHARRT